MDGWDQSGFDDAPWEGVAIFDPLPVHVSIQAYVGETIQARQEITAQSVNEPQPGVYVYDLGVNMVGVPRVKLKGYSGQRITLRFGEMIWPETMIHLNFMERQTTGCIQPAVGIGDHLAVESTHPMITHTAYFAYDAKLMAEMAEAIGKTDDAARYERLFQNIKTAFNKEFVDGERYTRAPEVEGAWGQWFPAGRVNTQASYALPLYMDLFNDSNKVLAAKHLAEIVAENGNRLTTGFIGTPYLNPALSENGYNDTAYALFEQTEYLSWLYPVLQCATTMWERWNSYTLKNGFGPVDMNSFNHYAYGAIGEWMFAHCLGIQRDEQQPGYRHIILQPRPGGSLSYARGYFDSVYGRIESGVPVKDVKGVTYTGMKDGIAVYELVPGNYEFTANIF